MVHFANLYNLAFFICRLFIDGRFRDGHILYNSNMFDDSLFSKINSICSVPIPWKFTDFSQSLVLSPPATCRTDYTMQLIFFDPNMLAKQIEQFKEYFTFYRIFVFPLISQNDIQKHIFMLKSLEPIDQSNILTLHYDSQTGSMDVHRIFGYSKIAPDLVEDLKRDITLPKINKLGQRIEYSNLFDRTFGKVEISHSIDINAACTFYTVKGHKKCFPLKGNLFLVNYFSSTLNAKRINMKLSALGSNESPSNEIVTNKRRQYYSDITLRYESMNDKV